MQTLIELSPERRPYVQAAYRVPANQTSCRCAGCQISNPPWLGKQYELHHTRFNAGIPVWLVWVEKGILVSPD